MKALFGFSQQPSASGNELLGAINFLKSLGDPLGRFRQYFVTKILYV
jgi:hypothetical protein